MTYTNLFNVGYNIIIIVVLLNIVETCKTGHVHHILNIDLTHLSQELYKNQ